MSEPTIPRKWPLKVYEQRNVFIKGNQESARHVIMKALLWALYLPQYPTITVEIRIGDKYKPDLVAYDTEPSIYEPEKPLFWGESGVVGQGKVESLLRRFPGTHFAIAKWDVGLAPYVRQYQDALDKLPRRVQRTAPVDLITCPPDSLTRFIASSGDIHITHDDLEWVRLT